jgi:glycosyltransferase involved in cell wall biosynthesis
MGFRSEQRAPALTFAICTRDRAKLLSGCLESLAAQTADPSLFELLVVDNASSDATASVCARFAAAHPGLPLRRVHEGGIGLSRARNRALEEASAPLVTFLDDDALAHSALAERVLEFFAREPDAGAVGGRVIPVFEGSPPAWQNRYSASLFFGRHDHGPSGFRHGRRTYPFGCNMTLRRTLALGLGGFRTDLGRGAGEGVGAEEKELFVRMRARNIAFYYDPQQVVHHRIPSERTRRPRTTQLARGLGRSQRRLCSRQAGEGACRLAALDLVLRLAAAIVLACAYAVTGRSAVSRHLVWFRWHALSGFLEESSLPAAGRAATEEPESQRGDS